MPACLVIEIMATHGATKSKVIAILASFLQTGKSSALPLTMPGQTLYDIIRPLKPPNSPDAPPMATRLCAWKALSMLSSPHYDTILSFHSWGFSKLLRTTS